MLRENYYCVLKYRYTFSNMNDSVKKPQTTPQPTLGEVDMDTMPLRGGHFWVLIVASLGQFIGQGLTTLVGVIIPMIEIMAHPELSAPAQGVLGCSALCGRTLGTVLFGKIVTRCGDLFVARICPLLMVAASIVAYLYHPVWLLCICLFLMGLSVGGEYSIDSDYISEIMPRRWKFFMVGVAKSTAALGSVVVAALCYWMIHGWSDASRWPELFFILTTIAGVIWLMRLHFTEAPGWLMARGHKAEAEAAVKYFLGKDVYMPSTDDNTLQQSSGRLSMWQFVKNNARKLVFTSLPWACEGLGVYGIGIFIPILIMSLGIDSVAVTATPLARIINSVELTILISVFMAVGFVLGLLLVRSRYHVSMQSRGFIGSALGLGVLLVATLLKMPSWIAIVGFVLFEVFLNAGPHLITFILPSQVYPVIDRSVGVGISAAVGKFGAVAGAFLVPVILKWWGSIGVVTITIVVMIIGAIITAKIGPTVLPKSETEPDVTLGSKHA